MNDAQPPLRLYNTLTRTKEVFAPIDPAKVRLYVCGPTVYDLAHIGNARPLIVFDVLYRLLRHRYGAEHVTYVRNITDVDDKINARAAERGISIRELTEETNRIFQEDVRALGCLDPTHQPRATEYVAKPEASWDMIRMISRLIEQGHAYEADGHVLFSVPSMPDYGRLSKRPLDEMIAGARVDVAPYKRADTDFVLWKPSRLAGDVSQQRHRDEPGWDSPWGFGRPGWHIECSAMSAALLGEQFDIHGGGIDLVFPHHENEIAQSRCCFNAPVMANVWMHNGFLQVEGEKMSKSLGNFVTIRDLLHNYHGNVVRLAMLRTHYRQPIDWTDAALQDAEREIGKWTELFEQAGVIYSPQPDENLDDQAIEALDDDLNTPLFLSRVRQLATNARQSTESARSLFLLLNYFGFRDLDIPGAFSRGVMMQSISEFNIHFLQALHFRNVWLNGLKNERQKMADEFEARGCRLEVDRIGSIEIIGAPRRDMSDQIRAQLEARLAARARKDWKESDRIRDELAAIGIALKDNKDGTTTWEVKR